jgi:hypothetical protein
VTKPSGRQISLMDTIRDGYAFQPVETQPKPIFQPVEIQPKRLMQVKVILKK